jgi:hypothetical protein
MEDAADWVLLSICFPEPSFDNGKDLYGGRQSAAPDQSMVAAAARRCWRHGVRPTTRSWGMRRYHTWAWSLAGQICPSARCEACRWSIAEQRSDFHNNTRSSAFVAATSSARLRANTMRSIRASIAPFLMPIRLREPGASAAGVPQNPRCSGARQQPTYAAQQIRAYSITSSARASSVGGMSRPSALAVLRLIISSNLVGRRTGRSLGCSPLRIRPVYTPA